MKYKIFASISGEENEGWVWLKNPNGPSRSIIRIKSKEVCKSIYCERRKIDENFLKIYNDPEAERCEIKQENEDSALVISEWYRVKLGIQGTTARTGKEVELDILGENTCWGKILGKTWGKIRSQTQHPQTVVRVATWIGLISLGLGILSIVLSVID